MTAVYGVVGAVTPAELDEMGRRLSHRGAHASWCEVAPNVHLGCAAREPSTLVQHGPWHSIVDGPSGEDAARIREAFAHCADSLDIGELTPYPFALAAWDARSQSLLLGRDFFGIKPLHYCRLPSGGIAFATEYKALLALEEVTAEADLDSVAYLQICKAVPPGRTLLRGISPIPPGCLMRFDRSGNPLEIHRMPEVRVDVRPMNEERAVAMLRKALLEATERLVRGKSRIAIAMSGGIDSLAVASMARHCAPSAELLAFTVAAHAADPEVDRAAEVVARLRGRHESIDVSNEELVAKLPLAVWHLENPIGRTETFQFFALAKRAREHGVDSLLSGMGADLLFAGMPRHKVLWMAECVPWLREDLLQFYAATQTGEPARRWLARCMTKLYFRAELPRPPSVSGAAPPDIELIASWGPEFLNRCLILDGQEPTSRTLARIERPLQAYSIEYASPYLDRSVAELAFRIPGRFKIKRGTQKYILRRAMQPLLGPRISRAPKELMRMQPGMQFSQALGELAHRYLNADRVRRRGFFDPEQIASLTRTCLRARHPEITMRLWTAILTEIWAEIYLDGRGRPPLPAAVPAEPRATWIPSTTIAATP